MQIGGKRLRLTDDQRRRRTHADVIAAADLFSAEVWTARGLIGHYVFLVIHHASRTVHIAGITTNPDSAFMAQVARILNDAGVKVVHTAVHAPNMNAFAERWVLSVKLECLDRMILVGEVVEHERLGGLLRCYQRAA